MKPARYKDSAQNAMGLAQVLPLPLTCNHWSTHIALGTTIKQSYSGYHFDVALTAIFQ